MESVWRALTVYLVLMIVFRLTGKRSLSQITMFDFVLLLIISEGTQQGLIGDDYSVTGAIVIVVTLISVDVLLSLLKQWSPTIGKIVDGTPLLLVDRGRVMGERLNRERISEDDIVGAARETRGLERLQQVKYAVLEQDGQISVIPWEQRHEPSNPSRAAATT